MEDIGLQILIGIAVTVGGFLISTAIVLILRHFKDAIKKKWQETRFRISIFIYISACLFVFGIFGLCIYAPIEVSIPTTIISIGIVMLMFIMLFSTVNTIADIFIEFREEDDLLKRVVKGLFQLSSDIPSEKKETEITIEEMLKILEELQKKRGMNNKKKQNTSDSSLEKYMK